MLGRERWCDLGSVGANGAWLASIKVLGKSGLGKCIGNQLLRCFLVVGYLALGTATRASEPRGSCPRVPIGAPSVSHQDLRRRNGRRRNIVA